MYKSACKYISISACLQDSSISKLTREIEALKKELRERDSQLTTVTSKMNKLKEPRNEERDARERELVSLRQVIFEFILCVMNFPYWYNY